MTTLLNKLHLFAIHRGWYKDITQGLPLNVIRTVFGTYALEGVYTMASVKELTEDMYEWGHHDSATWAEKDLVRMQFRLEAAETALSAYRTLSTPQYGPWRAKKDGSGYYRRIKYPNSMASWITESVKTLPE